MSAISTYLHQIITAIWAKDVRQAIHDAISQCYDDVNKPALQTEAMQAAVQAKIDAGKMAALTIADGSLTGAKLANGTIPTSKIADGAVTTAKIVNGAVTGAKVGTGTLTGDNIANKAIGTAKIDDGAVTWQKLASQAVHTAEIADGAVTGVKLADSSISNGKLASNAVTTLKIADGAVTAEKIASGVIPAVDTTLTQPGSFADAEAVGDAISEVREAIDEIDPFSEDAKAALLNCFAHVAWTDQHGQDYYDALVVALYKTPIIVSSISAVFNPGTAVIHASDDLRTLKQYLVVTAVYNDGTSNTVRNYILAGKLVEGENTIVVSYGGKSTTFTVTAEGGEEQVVKHYELSDSDTKLVQGGARTHEEYGLSIMSTARRLVFGMNSGVYSYRSYTDGSAIDIYPIPIPESVTKAVVSASARSSYSLRVDLQTRTYDSTTKYSAAVDSTGWQNPTGATVIFTPGVQYLVITIQRWENDAEAALSPSDMATVAVDFIK